jgi:hypothetical protein
MTRYLGSHEKREMAMATHTRFMKPDRMRDM